MMIKRRMIQGLLILALLCGAVLLAHPSAAWALTGTGTQADHKLIPIGSARQQICKSLLGRSMMVKRLPTRC